MTSIARPRISHEINPGAALAANAAALAPGYILPPLRGLSPARLPPAVCSRKESQKPTRSPIAAKRCQSFARPNGIGTVPRLGAQSPYSAFSIPCSVFCICSPLGVLHSDTQLSPGNTGGEGRKVSYEPARPAEFETTKTGIARNGDGLNRETTSFSQPVPCPPPVASRIRKVPIKAHPLELLLA